MRQEELNEILKLHEKWVSGETDGEQADLSYSDLYGADLSGFDLSYAVMNGADLTNARICLTNLHKANMKDSILTGADFYRSDLSEADLSNAHMAGVNLDRVYLRGANLYGAFLAGANLFNAYLLEANLDGAILKGANLYGACLDGATLKESVLTRANLFGICYCDGTKFDYDKIERDVPLICPSEGAFIGWKKARYNYIVKLKITEDSKRSSAFGRKCRCSKAVVLGIENIDGTPSGYNSIPSAYDRSFVYEIGKTVEVPNFCDDRLIECAPGIHFFITRQEAVNY